jgi:hypothetical protein
MAKRFVAAAVVAFMLSGSIALQAQSPAGGPGNPTWAEALLERVFERAGCNAALWLAAALGVDFGCKIDGPR